MKHCLIMTVYKDADMINRFIAAAPKEWGIYVHIDKKSILDRKDIIRFDYCIKENTIYWGSWKHLYSFWMLLEKAHEKGYDYYHLVTGQDFFATVPDKFDDILGNLQQSYMDIFSLPKEGWWGNGLSIYRYQGLSYYCDIRFGLAERANWFIRKLQMAFPIKRKLPLFPLYGGSVYCSLHDSLVEWMMHSYEAQNYLNTLKYCNCCEEIFFQTVAMLSPYRNKVVNNSLRYVDWEVENPPKILALNDYENVINSNNLFCRKNILRVGLIEKLEKYCNEG